MVDYHARALKAWDTRGRLGARPAESEGKGSWNPDGTFTPNEKAEEWARQRGVTPGDAPIPFPVWTEEERQFDPSAQDWNVGHRKIDKERPHPEVKTRTEEMIPVADLIATQRVATPASVKRTVEGLSGPGSEQKGRPVTVIRRCGKNFIYDGHHRAVAAKIRGDGTVRANVFEVPCA